ncbi:MAG: cell division ATP-binding protein FtsE [Armatimonadetes bacterium]|nr:cell division ATP-binding protein FtsE [Armatimonadota bacterium]
MIQTLDVSVVYNGGPPALRDVSLRIEKGEFIFIVGPTGMGKSTFLKLINREAVPAKGKVIVAGRDITKLEARHIPELRRQIGVVFQDFQLLPQKTVWENVAFALQAIGADRHRIYREVPRALELVSLTHKANSYPQELSGGEQQRVSIARAIVNNPAIVLADEPTGNLDPETSWDIVQLLSKINIRGSTVVVATHDKYIVDGMKKRVVAIENGQVVRDEPGGYHHAVTEELGILPP